MRRALLIFFIALQITFPIALLAQEPSPTPVRKLENLLVDRTGDGLVQVLAFGDSVTTGIGDEEEMGGYPERLEGLLKVDVLNAGVPGEELCNGGIERFADRVASSRSDIVIILEGFNDARGPCADETYQRLLQRAINITIAMGKEPVVMTLMQPIANHFFLAPYTPGYSSIVRALAALNAISYVDLEHAWGTTCAGDPECPLFNIPEGLHPTSEGYTAISQAVAATLLGIDIFSPEGAAQLEQATGLPAGSVIIKPDLVQEAS